MHRYRRVDAAVEHVAEEVDDLRTDSRPACRERVRAQEQDRSHRLLGEERADADRVAAHEVALQGPELLVRDADGREVTEARVHAVHGVVLLGDLGDDPRRLLHLPLGGAVQAHRDVASRDGDDVGDGEIVPGEAEGRYFRFSRYQRARSV